MEANPRPKATATTRRSTGAVSSCPRLRTPRLACIAVPSPDQKTRTEAWQRVATTHLATISDWWASTALQRRRPARPEKGIIDVECDSAEAECELVRCSVTVPGRSDVSDPPRQSSTLPWYQSDLPCPEQGRLHVPRRRIPHGQRGQGRPKPLPSFRPPRRQDLHLARPPRPGQPRAVPSAALALIRDSMDAADAPSLQPDEDPCNTGTQTTQRDTEEPREAQSNKHTPLESSAASCAPSASLCVAAIDATLPTGAGQRRRRIFDLAVT